MSAHLQKNASKRVLQYCARCTSTMGEDLVAQNCYLFNHSSIIFDVAILFAADLNESFRQRVLSDGNLFLLGTLKEKNYFTHFVFYIKLLRLMRKQHYKALFAHESTPLFLIPCWLAKIAGIKKIIVLAHSATAEDLPRWMKLFHSFVFRFIVNERLAVSKKAGLALYGPKLSFQVIHNGIDTRRFTYNPEIRQEVRKKLSLDNHPVFGFIGRFENEKNVLFLIDVFAAIYRKNPEARFLLVGSGSLEKDMLEKIDKLQLHPFIQLLRPPQDTAQIYQALDAFLLPSIHEGLPLVLLEAQTAGVPCFVSDTVTREVEVCNTTFIPLSEDAPAWADIILSKTKNFTRQDCSSLVKQAGFDIQDFMKKLEGYIR